MSDAIARMFTVAPRDWWRFIGCRTCNSQRQEVCRQGGESWPAPAWQPHKSRVDEALALHSTLWLITNGFESDVLGAAS